MKMIKKLYSVSELYYNSLIKQRILTISIDDLFF